MDMQIISTCNTVVAASAPGKPPKVSDHVWGGAEKNMLHCVLGKFTLGYVSQMVW